MKNKRIANLLFASLFLFPVLRTDVELVIPSATPTPTPAIKLINPSLIKKFDLVELKFTNKRGQLKNVEVTAVSDTSITVNNEGTSVKVDILTNTHFRRKFWGKSSLAEISIGNKVDIVGRWANEEKSEIKAVLIRNLSIQKRFGTFFGTINKITDTGFIMTTIQRGEETVTIDTAKLINRTQQVITKEDLQIGHRVRVKGLWDSVNFTITEVTQIKDFSLPPFATPTPTP